MSSTFVTEPELEIPLACNLGALDAGSRSDHISSAGHLLNDVAQERRESTEGFSFRFTAEDYSRIVEFIANERLCCPFFHFTLEVSPAQGPIWLHLTGPDGAKSFLQAELSLN
jgi:hypothetical protein